MREHYDRMAGKLVDERLRQERETFDQHKANQHRWFRLRLAMGWVAVVLLPSILLVSGYILVKHASFPPAVVTTAGGALLVDALGIVFSVWKIVLDREFMTQLAPITDVKLLDMTLEGIGDDGELTILSARYGVGDMLKDVTGLLRSHVSEGTLAIQANNDALGGDPAPHRVKQLVVIYRHGGQTFTKTIPETGWLHLP